MPWQGWKVRLGTPQLSTNHTELARLVNLKGNIALYDSKVKVDFGFCLKDF